MSETGTPAPAATPPAPTPPAAWFNGVYTEQKDQDAFVGHLQNRGWDKLTPEAAAKAAAKAHREAEAHIGVPADKLVRLPKDAADADGWAAFRSKIGVPADPKEYDFSKVKFANGADLGADFTGTLSAALSKANVAKDGAPEIAQAVVKFMEAASAGEDAESAAKIAAGREALEANWGSNYKANMLVAQNAFKALGAPAEAVGALEKAVGYDKVMEMFRSIGMRIGEDAFIKSTAPGQTGVQSKEQATATLAERMNDAVWADKLSKGDSLTVREFDTLTRLMQ